MTERWRKKLSDLDETGPGEDVFARAHEGPTQPDDVIPLPKTSTRIVTGIAAFAVFALAISVFAIPVLRMNDQPASIGGSQILPLWPERSLDDLEALQQRADSGEADAVWATDPAQVATKFGQEVMGWESVELSEGGNSICDPGPTGVCTQDVGISTIGECSPYGLPNGETGFACVGTAVAALGSLDDHGETVNDGSTATTSGDGPSTGVPDPFRTYLLRYPVACGDGPCPSPTSVRLYQPLGVGEGKIWAVLAAASEGAELNVATGQALEDGYGIDAALRTHGTTTPTLAYASGLGSCSGIGFTGRGETDDDTIDHLTLDVRAGCASDSPGYVWAAQTWKPTIGSSDVLDPLTEGGYGDPSIEFVAVSVTFLAVQASGTFTEQTEPPPSSTPSSIPNSRAEGTSTFTDDRFGISIDVPESWAWVEPYKEAGQVGFHIASGDIGFQDAPDRIERVYADPGDVVLFIWTEPADTSVADDVLPGEGFDEGSQVGATTIRGEFRGDGLLWHYLAEAGEGDDQIPEHFLPTLDATLASIRFEPWEVGETRGAWTAIDGPGEDTASWESLDRAAVGVVWIGGGYIVIDAPDGCFEGLRTVVGGWPVVTCPDGTTIGYDENGDPFESNPQGFHDPALVYPAIVAHDGHLLVLRSDPPS